MARQSAAGRLAVALDTWHYVSAGDPIAGDVAAGWVAARLAAAGSEPWSRHPGTQEKVG